MTRRYYAGIGSRKTPQEAQDLICRCAAILEERGLILRSGGAEGADSAFEDGVIDPAMKEIFLPWRGFNGNKSMLYADNPAAEAMAVKYHPAWDRLTQGARKMMARNMQQILGKDLSTPVLFVLCWTPNGSGSGGTGQAIRLADDLEIPVFDLGKHTVDEIGPHITELLNK